MKITAIWKFKDEAEIYVDNLIIRPVDDFVDKERVLFRVLADYSMCFYIAGYEKAAKILIANKAAEILTIVEGHVDEVSYTE